MIEKKIAQIKFDLNTINSEIANSKKMIEGENKNLTSSLKQMTNDFHIIRDVLEAVKNNRKVDKTQLDKINFTLIDQITNTNEKINRENELLKQIAPDFPIKLRAQSINLLKKDIIEYGIKNKISIHKTSSCDEASRCYKCESCREVIDAFDELGKSSKLNQKDFNKFNPYKSIHEK